MGYLLIIKGFQAAGIFQKSDENWNNKALKEKLSIITGYTKFYEELLEILSRNGFIKIQEEAITTSSKLESEELKDALTNIASQKDQLISSYPEMKTHIHLAYICMDSFMDVLQGKVVGTDIMFPGSSMKLVEGIYKGNRQVDYYNQALTANITSFIKARLPKLKEGEIIKILEVGSGTGSSSAMVFDAVQEYSDRLSYIYTDISPGLINYGKRTFGQKNSFVEFKLLNIEKGVEEQGHEIASCDIVIATNVLHATCIMRNTIRQAKTLLKKNGWLIINEGTKNQDFLTFTFGLLDGWWLYEDDISRLPGGPLLNLKGWREVLSEAGFSPILSLNESGEKRLNIHRMLLLLKVMEWHCFPVISLLQRNRN